MIKMDRLIIICYDYLCGDTELKGLYYSFLSAIEVEMLDMSELSNLSITKRILRLREYMAMHDLATETTCQYTSNIYVAC